jgi:hypothetical protein
MLAALLARLNGWKSIISYLLLQVPGLSDYPGVVTAIQEALANPTKQNVINLVLQLALVGALSHKALKNVSGK